MKIIYSDIADGKLEPANNIVERKLSDMTGMYFDSIAEKNKIKKEDPVIYKVTSYLPANEGTEGELFYGMTKLYSGTVGDEFYMTKGHFHEQEEQCEVYLGVEGKGLLLLEDHDNNVEMIEVKPKRIVYIPPATAHRMINIGDKPFTFLGIWPAEAGHNYGDIENKGFSKIVVKDKGTYLLKDNN